MQRWFHARDFAVDRQQQVLPTRFDGRLLHIERIEIVRLIQPADQSVQCQAEQTESPRPVRQIKTQFASIQMSATANAKPGHVVLVITNKNERRLSVQFPVFNADTQMQKGKPAKRQHRRPRECRPFAPLKLFLLRLAMHNDARIQSKA
jgi:hypothetical protein